jgi:hypothetical protein
MLAMLLSATAIVALSFPYVVRPLIRMTLECREVPAVYKKLGDDEAGAEGMTLAADRRARD